MKSREEVQNRPKACTDWMLCVFDGIGDRGRTVQGEQCRHMLKSTFNQSGSVCDCVSMPIQIDRISDLADRIC